MQPTPPLSRPEGPAPPGHTDPTSGAGDGPPAAPLDSILDDPVAFGRLADELRRWRRGFPDRGRPLASLLDALVWFFKLRAQTTIIEATSTARRSMAELKEEERQLIDEELDRARDALPAFEAGLRPARTAGGSEISLESQDPEQDRIAGALIGYLVATDFATVRTDELPGQRYRYNLAVDWARLDDFAVRLGLPAPSQLD